MIQNIIYIVIGIVGGVFGGLGMGGGTLLIPLLVSFSDLQQQTSQMANLISFIPMSIVALIIHIKNKLVEFQYLLWISLPAVVSSVAVAFLTKGIKGEVLGKCFGVFLIVLGIVQIVSLIIKNVRENKTKSETKIKE